MWWKRGRYTGRYRMYPWRRPSRRPLLRRVLLVLSAGLFIMGAALLGTGLYRYFDQSEADPFAFLHDTTSRPRPTATPSSSATATPAAPSPPVAIRIDAIEINAPVITLGLDSNHAPEVPDDIYARNTDDAGGVVAWYNFSATPGGGSNAVFAAHVTWDYKPAVFWSIDDLQPGDRIVLTSGEGRELVYEVFANFLVDPTDPDALKVMDATEEDIITLITCGGQWLPNPSEQYGGEYVNRVIVQARLVGASAG